MMYWIFTLVVSACGAWAVEGDQVVWSKGEAVSDALVLPACDSEAGRLIITGFNGTQPTDPEVKTVGELLKRKLIGGVILYSRNIESPPQLKALTTYLKAAAEKVLICIDGEGGRVRRLTKEKGFEFDVPTALDIAQRGLEKAGEIFKNLAQCLAEYEINVNFAPVVDLHSPASQAIGKFGRSFSADPQEIVPFASEFIQQHRALGVFTCLKHFPGHGLAQDDTHNGLVDATNHADLKRELIPYESLIKDGKAPMIMMSHIINRTIDPDHPASLSAFMHKLLRDDLKYNGLIISDDLLMGAITQQYTVENYVQKAFDAGTDILLFSKLDLDKLAVAWQTLKARKVEASMARLNQLWQVRHD
jgi:beta-N-acetylhexosaminidase